MHAGDELHTANSEVRFVLFTHFVDGLHATGMIDVRFSGFVTIVDNTALAFDSTVT